jgi:hypothetical protein
MASYPSKNDRDYDLWKKIAWNYYYIAVNNGHSVESPKINDGVFSLLKKIVNYTALISNT